MMLDNKQVATVTKKAVVEILEGNKRRSRFLLSYIDIDEKMSEKNVKVLFQTEGGMAETVKAESNLTVFTA